jgi:hypothetical protein
MGEGGASKIPKRTIQGAAPLTGAARGSPTSSHALERSLLKERARLPSTIYELSLMTTDVNTLSCELCDLSHRRHLSNMRLSSWPALAHTAACRRVR